MSARPLRITRPVLLARRFWLWSCLCKLSCTGAALEIVRARLDLADAYLDRV